MSKKLLVGNWKLHPHSLEEAERTLKGLARFKNPNLTVVVCPPAVFLSALSKKKGNIFLGVQDVFYESVGAYTGEYSPAMAKSAGAQFAIVGHSERRAMGETNLIVAKKIAATLKAGLTGILCIGEKERDGHGHYLSYLKAQIDESLEEVPKNHADRLVVAYEPLWAIGEKALRPMDARELHETVLFIRKVLHDRFGKKALSIPVLYGGSVDPSNAHELLSEGTAGGLLVGRESVRADHFLKIAKAVIS